MESRRQSKFNVQIYEEATEWFIECRTGELSEGARRQLDEWLRKSPEHLSAYLEIAALWNAGSSLDLHQDEDIELLVAAAREDSDNVIRLSSTVPGADGLEDFARSPSRSAPPPLGRSGSSSVRFGPRVRLAVRRWHLGAAIGVLALVAGTTVWLALVSPSVYATSIGEQRSIVLDDGSTVALNSRSKIAVHFSRDERDITLVAGQALFHVAKDSTRPFVVKSGDTRVRAVGTEFDVYNKILGTVVTVVEGHVAVLPGPAQLSPAVLAPSPQGSLGPPNAPRNASSASGLASLLPSGEPRAILLAAGEQLTVSATNVERVDHPNVSSATAWTQHQLIFDSASLSEVVLEFNRYNKRPLVVEGPDPDGFHLSGVFSSTDPTSLIQFLRERPGLRILETPTEVRIERNNSHER